MSSLNQQSCKFNEIIRKSNLIENGNPARYHLQTKTDNLDQSVSYKKMTFGERDKNKPNKTVLMVGETGAGKTTLINVMINYMLGVQREDKVWFEITDDQSDRTSTHTQTSSLTVYEFYLQESPIDLTIIDTPGYGNTRGNKNDQEITMGLLSLSNFTDWLHEIHAVCLVIDASQTRLSDRQIYIYDAVQSLFGRDIAENIVLLLTHSSGTHPKNALNAVKEAKIKCSVNDENQPVFYLFNNCQTDNADEECEEYEMIQEQSWQLSFKGMAGLFMFLDTKKPRSMQITRDALQKWKQLEAKISKLQSYVQEMVLKQNELKLAMEEKTHLESQKKFEYEVEVPYKEKVDTDPKIAKMAMCCTFCEENCHYEDTWWDKLFNSLMKDDHCTVCTNKCHYSKHIKSAKIYVKKTKKEKKTNEDLKKEYDDKIGEFVSLVKKLEEELQELEKEKIKVVMDAFHCVDALQMIGLNVVPLIKLQHIDFLVENLKEINELDKAEVLINIKKSAGTEK